MTDVPGYRAELAASVGLAAADLDRPVTSLHPEADRAGSSVLVAYRVGARTLLRSDPALADEASDLIGDVAWSLDDVVLWANGRGWQLHGGGDQHVLGPHGMTPTDRPPGARSRRADPADADDRAALERLIAACDDEDVGFAELDLDDPDDRNVVLTDTGGQVVAWAGSRPYGEGSAFDDIGVLVHPDHRGTGWGRAAVADLVADIEAAGRRPLYRCDWTRTASKAVAVGLGFVEVVRLVAVGPPPAA